MLFNGLVQPLVPKAGLGHLCCFAVGNVSPHPTGESKTLKKLVFYWSFALLSLEYCSPGRSGQSDCALLVIDRVSESTAVATQYHC